MELIMLGTGHAGVTECYNTCFLLKQGEECFLVDTGGGNGLLTRLKQCNVQMKQIHDIFITHRHLDHITGMLWVLRKTLSSRSFTGKLNVYSHKEVINIIKTNVGLLFTETEAARCPERINFIEVSDGDEAEIMGHRITFFDIHSTKATQFGFCYYYDDVHKLTCCGDEPYRECEHDYVLGSQWLLHEAFCLYSEAEKYEPYKKSHSTVKDGCEVAERLQVANTVLYHAEESNLATRKERYLAEGRQYYHGNLYVPDDLDVISL